MTSPSSIRAIRRLIARPKPLPGAPVSEGALTNSSKMRSRYAAANARSVVLDGQRETLLHRCCRVVVDRLDGAGDAIFQELGVPGDRAERILDVVGDASNERFAELDRAFQLTGAVVCLARMPIVVGDRLPSDQ